MLRRQMIVGLLTIIGLGAQQATSQKVGQDARLPRLEVSVEKTTYNVAEPLELIVALYNDQNEVTKGNFYLALAINRLWVYYRKVGGEFVRYFPRWVQTFAAVHGIGRPVEIPPLGKKEEKERLFYDTYEKRFVLAEPGEYEFKATFNLGNDRIIESNIVRVTVVEPSEDERAALTALSDPVLASFIEGDLRPGLAEEKEVEAGAERAIAFLEKYGNSLHATLAEEQLRKVLTEARQKGKLTERLQAIKERLPEK